MIYYETPGVLQDVTYFLTLLYNEEFLISKTQLTNNDKENDCFRFYYELKQKYADQYHLIHAFIYSSDTYYSFLNTVIRNFDYPDLTLEKFINYISDNQFISDFYKHWFFESDHIAPQSIDELSSMNQMSLTSGLKVPEQIKYRLLTTMRNFNNARLDLIHIVRGVYADIKKLRAVHKGILEQCKESVNSDISTDALSDMFKLERGMLRSYYFTVLLVNSLNLNCVRNTLSIGVLFKITEARLKHVSIESFAYAYGDETRAKIVSMLMDKKYQCINDFIKSLDLKQPTVYHHINILYNEGIVVISKRISKRFYYSINPEYFSRLGDIINETYNKPGVESFKINAYQNFNLIT